MGFCSLQCGQIVLDTDSTGSSNLPQPKSPTSPCSLHRSALEGPVRGSGLGPTGHIPQASYFPPALSLSFPNRLQGGNDYHRFMEQCSVVPQAARLISVEQRHKAGCAKPLPVYLPGSQLCKAGQSGGPAAQGGGAAACLGGGGLTI